MQVLGKALLLRNNTKRGGMGIHREGVRILALLALVSVAVAVALFLFTYWVIFLTVAVLLVLLLLFVGHFFRRMVRSCPGLAGKVYSPADGRVVAIERVYEPEVFNDEVQVVSIFMSVWNVHANAYPVSGYVDYVRYHKGKFLVAWHPKSSTENERTTVVVRTEQGVRVLFRQIAGAVARRICCYAQEGENVKAGTEFGFIKFGSRVDIFIPLDARVSVALGDKVRACETLIAEL